MSTRIVPMEGMRGFAVSLVFLVHFAALAVDTPPVGWVLEQAGHHGVDLFFVLSGFLIYRGAMAPDLKLAVFLARRAWRVYPTFLAVLAVYLVISLAMPQLSKLPDDPAAAALHVLANILLLPGVFPIEPIITVAWSLSYELAYYLLCPIVVVTLRMRRWHPLWRAALWLLIAVAFFTFPTGHLRAVMFVPGALLHEALGTARLAVPGWLAGPACLASLVAAGTHHLVGPPKFAALSAAFFMLCLSAFRGGWLAHVFSWRPLRWLGNISYSYYLIHGLALKALTFVMPVPYFIGLLPAFAATLGAGAVLYAAVERPCALHAPTPQAATVDSPGLARCEPNAQLRLPRRVNPSRGD